MKTKKVKLGDVCSIKHGYAFKGAHITHDKTPFELVTPGNFSLCGGFQHANKPKYYNGDFPDEYILNAGDLIVTMTDLSSGTDTLGYGALVPDDGNSYLHNQRIGLVSCDESMCSKDYLHWLMRSPHYQKTIANRASGSTVKHTAPKTILAYELNLPPLATQTQIARILSAFDSKIEVNNKLNAKLEELAQAVFEEKLRSLTTEEVLLSKIATIKYGKGLATSNLLKTGYPVFGGNGKIGYYSEFLYDEPQIIISCRGAASGNILITSPRSFVTSNSLVIELNDRRYFEWLKRYFLINQLHDYATGSAQPQITIDNLKFITVPYPEYNQIASITEKLKSFSDYELSLQKESLTLATLRDTLLPKLMRGELTPNT